MQSTTKEEFYTKVSEILNIEHTYAEPALRRTRWNTRLLGNGRFPGFGLVQHCGSYIRIISKQTGTIILDTPDETYEFLRKQRFEPPLNKHSNSNELGAATRKAAVGVALNKHTRP
jgi:hypothetical protein